MSVDAGLYGSRIALIIIPDSIKLELAKSQPGDTPTV